MGRGTFSLIVATRNRPRQLSRLFASLVEQRYQDLEVVVVDQSDPSVRQVNEAAARPLKERGICVRLVTMQGTGLSRARNVALELVHGAVIGFPDDDCWYPPGLLDRVAEWFERNRRFAFLVGQYTEPGVSNPRFPNQPTELRWNEALRRVSSVGLFVRRDAVELTGLRFDERLGVGSLLPAAEEVDFVLNLLRLGYRGYYEPSVEVYHAIHRESNTVYEWRVKRAEAAGYVLAKHALLGHVGIGLSIARHFGRSLVLSLVDRHVRDFLAARVRGYSVALRDFLGRG